MGGMLNSYTYGLIYFLGRSWFCFIENVGHNTRCGFVGELFVVSKREQKQYPTEHFTILEPEIPAINLSLQHKIASPRILWF